MTEGGGGKCESFSCLWGDVDVWAPCRGRRLLDRSISKLGVRKNEKPLSLMVQRLLSRPELMISPSAVITDPDDSRFDLEAYLTMKAAE